MRSFSSACLLSLVVSVAACGGIVVPKTAPPLVLPESTTPPPSSDVTLETLVGTIQFEKPCLLDGFPDGCLRLVGGGDFIAPKVNYLAGPGIRFEVLNGLPRIDLTTYLLHFGTPEKTVLVGHDQPVRMKVVLDHRKTGPLCCTIQDIEEVTLPTSNDLPRCGNDATQPPKPDEGKI